MKIHVSIGENHHFELREALLVYRDRQSSFITRHDVTAQKDAPPTLGPAQPLTVAFIESMVRSLTLAAVPRLVAISQFDGFTFAG